jgi:Trypsin-like peptidase domain
VNPQARKLIETVSRYATPLILYPHNESAIDDWLTGGTGVLVQTPLNRFVITADHVVAKIEEIREQRPAVTLLCGTHAPPFDISDWQLIDRSKSLDICVIQVPSSFNPHEINKTFCKVDFSTVRPAEKEEEALIIGFPWAHRNATGLSINTRMLPIFDFVTSVSEARFVIADPERERQVLENTSGLDVPEHMGGASGAPVFRVNFDTFSELIGIFTDGGDGLHGVYFCTHVRFLSNDGKLNPRLLPP